jgi:hypothetical protein
VSDKEGEGGIRMYILLFLPVYTMAIIDGQAKVVLQLRQVNAS